MVSAKTVTARSNGCRQRVRVFDSDRSGSDGGNRNMITFHKVVYYKTRPRGLPQNLGKVRQPQGPGSQMADIPNPRTLYAHAQMGMKKTVMCQLQG
jgi:hypothetical protein